MTNEVANPVPAAPSADIPRRLEGRDKVMGRARYAGDFTPQDVNGILDVAVVITSTQASGRVLSIDPAAALQMPGVRLVITHENAPRLKKVLALNGAEIGDHLPLQDDQLRYGDQCIALVVADTLEHARAAVPFVVVRYSAPEPTAVFTLAQGKSRVVEAKTVGSGTPGQVKIGEPEEAYQQATHRVDLNFHSAPHHHNAMEPGAVVAAWGEDGGLTVHLPTQFCYGEAVILGQAFGFGLKDRLPRIIAQVLGGFAFDNKVRVISTLAGGAFGGKNGNIHLLLGPMAAKLNGRPVKLVLTREQTFSMMPFRGESQQRVRLGANENGKLQAILHDALMSKGTVGQFIEPLGEVTTKLYQSPNIGVHRQTAALDTNAPGWMRGPGPSIGQFALESAIDELAYQMGIDPLNMRLRNYAEVEPDTGYEWSSKSLRECYQAAAQRIGWFERDPQVGSMREEGRLIGFGMASACYPTQQMPSVARIILGTDGRATVQSSSQEIGQGMITALTQIAANSLGLELGAVRLEWGDTTQPYGGMAVGSSMTLSSGAAIREAALLVQKRLIKRVVNDKRSPLYGESPEELRISQGQIEGLVGIRESVVEAMGRYPDEPINEEAITGRTFGRSSYGRAAFGAQFVKVSIDPDTRHLQVERLIGAFAAGHIVNPILARSQLLGGMVWGVGQALFEESSIDLRTGRWMNHNLGEALVPTHADIIDLDAILIEEDDTRGHPLGVKGLGEIGTVGTSAAIANAIFHATGQRITSLPMRLDTLRMTNR